MTQIKKLIEVSLPLDAINAESAREKSIRHGHPSTLHLWWARRPLAAARAVLWSSLVDDPSSHPELFPTEEDQSNERERLHNLLAELVKWENSNNEEVLKDARAEIRKYMGEEKLVFLDPFAGGGSIPLEAQRLGMEAHAHDLNPVAVMINKAMIEIPPKFAGKPPINPEGRKDLRGKTWPGASGLAEDVRYYGQWMKEEAFRRIGHLYPKVKLSDGSEATIIAWIWARTVKCPNPACGCEMPLVKSFELSKKKGNEAFILPSCENGKITYSVKQGNGAPEGTVNRRGARCFCCQSPVGFPYIREEGKAGRMGSRLIAVVAEGNGRRQYLSATDVQAITAEVQKPENYPDGEIFGKAKVNVGNYGLLHFSDLFTPRQLTALTTFSNLVREAQEKATQDALAAGMADDGIGLADGGTEAKAYGEAVGVYLAFVADKLSDINSSIVAWNITREGLRNTFGRQAIPMTWDYAEANPFSSSSGCISNMIEWIYKYIIDINVTNSGYADQKNAQNFISLHHPIISTDPPYYDNIGYADLSDYFYIWMRQSLIKTYPDIFKTMLVPKAEELVATHYRFNGNRQKAKEFFENGMKKAFVQMQEITKDDVPVSIYYAFKQSETDEHEQIQTASTGWETMLSALIEAGFAITGTWPMRTERSVRAIAMNTNALASSIVLVCRKRSSDAPVTTRRAFMAELKKSLPPALEQLQASNIAPVDMAQAAIGPGMAVFSKYSQILDADGSPMSVRAALQAINAELDSFFSEQDGALDEASRFCVALYTQNAFNEMRFGEADVLARAKNTSVEKLSDMGVLFAEKGVVRLRTREELPEKPMRLSLLDGCLWLLTQYLVKAIESGSGIRECASLAVNHQPHAEAARDLAYRLFSIAERKKWSDEAFAYNALVTAWPEIQQMAIGMSKVKMEQATIY